MSDHTEEIRARVEKASCGPWQVIRKGDPDNDWLLASFGAASDDDRFVELHTDGVRGDGLSSAENDAEFCAHARTDVPYLLSELTALRQENARLKGALEEADEAMQYVLPELPQFPPPCSYSVLRAAHRVVDAALSSSPAQEQKK